MLGGGAGGSADVGIGPFGVLILCGDSSVDDVPFLVEVVVEV